MLLRGKAKHASPVEQKHFPNSDLCKPTELDNEVGSGRMDNPVTKNVTSCVARIDPSEAFSNSDGAGSCSSNAAWRSLDGVDDVGLVTSSAS